MGHDEPYFAGDVAYVFRLPIAMRQPENAFYAPMAMLGTPIAIFRLPTAAPLPTAPPKSYPPRQSPPRRATRRCQTKPARARCADYAVCTRAVPRRFPAIARTNACCLKRGCCRFAIGCDGRPASCAKPFGVFRLRGGQSAACGCRGCRGR